MKKIVIALTLVLMCSVINAQTSDDNTQKQHIKKEKEKTTATVFIHAKDKSKTAGKRIFHRNNIKRKFIKRKIRPQTTNQPKEKDLMNLGIEMDIEMGMETMQGMM